MDTLKERYLQDKDFHDLVSWLRRFVADGMFTKKDIQDAFQLVAEDYCNCDDMYYSKYTICPTCKKPYP